MLPIVVCRCCRALRKRGPESPRQAEKTGDGFSTSLGAGAAPPQRRLGQYSGFEGREAELGRAVGAAALALLHIRPTPLVARPSAVSAAPPLCGSAGGPRDGNLRVGVAS
jgi:hypothetical protein